MKSLFIATAITFQILNMANASASKQIINISVTEKGFEPSTLKVNSGDDISLAVTRKTDSTCAKEILFPAQKIKKELPLNKTVTINLGKLKKGEVSFSCGMNMVSGVINVQ
jgi:plastocyanin domain-containing protein